MEFRAFPLIAACSVFYWTAMESDAPECSPVFDADGGNAMFAKAVLLTLREQPSARAATFGRFAEAISAITLAPDSGMRPWEYIAYDGVDGSRIFRGGLGLSLVVDPGGRLWRARNHEDFETTWDITATSAEIRTLNPDYPSMREYVRDGDAVTLVPPLPDREPFAGPPNLSVYGGGPP